MVLRRFCDMLQFGGEVRSMALTQLMLLLCHTFPIVRKTAANKFYEAAVTYDNIIPESAVEDVTALLVESLWYVFLVAVLLSDLLFNILCYQNLKLVNTIIPTDFVSIFYLSWLCMIDYFAIISSIYATDYAINTWELVHMHCAFLFC